MVPTLKTANTRICLLLPTGDMGMLRISDAERLQARPHLTSARALEGITTVAALCCRGMGLLRIGYGDA